ncbi:peptidoglycan D,D-transpeptidase FtsI family protein [Candidatus Magnetomonas plexicatena]|uniref:peptidoglycan D,D-transpeptidase FtsI family protein n=1 Tax=Candidatus Magnetomonas plexicatena TaxID=2552947 RepID=UPI001C76219E|nr:penicillin-binding protein 2 [Nitrospirales bacterium LBB_01]
MGKRVYFVFVLIALGFLAVVGRLFDLMVLNHDKFVKKSANQRIAEVDIQVRRGMIFDRKGRRLVANLEQGSVYLDRANFGGDNERLFKLAKMIDVNVNDLSEQLKSSKNFLWIKRKISLEDTAKVESLKIGGIGITPEAKRYYTLGSFASHIIGFVNLDNKGLEGVESKYDKELTGEGGTYSVQRDARGNRFYSENDAENSGNSLVLTVDEGLQYIVEKELDEAIKKWRAVAATAIMLNPFTGEILAMSNRPTYDPNNPAKTSPAARRNRAVTDVYEPGSTFKVVTASGVLEERLAREDDRIDCSGGGIEVGGKIIKDAHPHGVLTFMEVIQKSSNVGTIKLAQRLGKQRLYKYIKKFGFGDKSGIDLPGEVSGLIKSPERWSGVSIGAMPIGQEVAVTPLQIVSAYSTIANGGYKVHPHVVKGVIRGDGVFSEINKAEPGEQILSKRVVDIVTRALMMVTQQGGTAKYAEVVGNRVAGKTGTAQMYDRNIGRYSSTDFISSFVGFVPAEKPAFAMVVVVWKPRGEIYGGLVAAPVFKNIAEKALTYLNVPREDMIKNNVLVVERDSRTIGVLN